MPRGPAGIISAPARCRPHGDERPAKTRPQPQTAADFGVYAAYGGVFVVMSLLRGWGIDGHPPDTYDPLGAAIVTAGVAVIVVALRPRG